MILRFVGKQRWFALSNFARLSNPNGLEIPSWISTWNPLDPLDSIEALDDIRGDESAPNHRLKQVSTEELCDTSELTKRASVPNFEPQRFSKSSQIWVQVAFFTFVVTFNGQDCTFA